MSAPCVCTTIRKADRALFRLYEAALAPCSVSISQFAILRALERNGSMALSRLADELVMERTSLYRTLQPLEDRAAVAVRASGHGKARIAELTDHGKGLITEATPYWQEAQDQVIGRLGTQNWRELSAAFAEIATGFHGASKGLRAGQA